MAVTLKDVADQANVSVATASLVLSGKHVNRVSADTVRRVQDTASKMQYRSNRVARSLRQRSAPVLGLLSLGVATSPYAGRMLEAAQSTARQHDYDLLFIEIADEGEIGASLNLLQEHQVAGSIVASFFHQRLDLPTSVDGPLVVLDAVTDNPAFDSVVPDEAASERAVLRMLAEAGHTKVAWISEHPVFPAAFARREAFMSFAKEHGWDRDSRLIVEMTDRPDASDGYIAFRALIDQYPDVTAVACYNDRMAMGAYMAAFELGLRIPHDISIVGFDDQVLISEALRPGLSTVALPHRAMGEWAVERLIAQIEAGGELAPEQVKLPGDVVRRDSVTTPRTGAMNTSARSER